jgi:hypothetical protein
MYVQLFEFTKTYTNTTFLYVFVRCYKYKEIFYLYFLKLLISVLAIK